MVRARHAWLLALCLTSAPALARADGPSHHEGDYGGVTPGEPPAKDTGKPSHKRPPAKDTLTWIGFAAKDGGAQLFFQAPAAFTASQHVDKGQLIVLLEGLHRQVRNTRRPLDTRYFDTSIARVVARAVGAHHGHKAGIEVRITFKNPKDAHEGSMRTATEADGMFYTYLDVAGSGDVPGAGSGSGSGSGTGDGGDAADGSDE
jgi:hypothetical protein